MDELLELDFWLLGGFEAVSRAGSRLKFTNRKVAQLAALLATKPGIPRDRSWLAATVWPDSDAETGLASLRNAIAVLKKDLSVVGDVDRLVEADRTQVCFNSKSVGSDAARFVESMARAKKSETDIERERHLEDALALYRGPFYPEAEAGWIDQERSHFARLGEDAVCQLVAIYEKSDRVAAAADIALMAANGDPENELKLQLALRSLTEAARGGEAVGLYRRYERGLRERLGVSPAPETLALAREAKGRSRSLKEAPPSNLPQVLAPFFGRHETLTEITRLVSSGSGGSRVVTLLGPGGIGKTRLAIEVANAVKDQLHGAAWLVELAAVADPADIIATAVHSLVPDSDAAPLIETLSQVIGGRPCLMVVDNLEQIGPGLGAILTEILGACPGLRILATSREPIGMPDETVRQIDPLPVPSRSDPVFDSPSVQLFVDRARQASSKFTEEDPEVMAALVQRLEGMPLAICLAAAQADLLTPSQILSQLEDRFGLLATENTRWPDRHKRLWTCIDWSYRLHPETHNVLKRLSCFRNGWTAQTAQWACPETVVHSQLQVLLRSSLVFEKSRKGKVRFDMFESIREFVVASTSPEEAALGRERHADAVRKWLKEAKEKGQSFNTGYIPERAAEYENFRVAYDWALDHEPELALDIANSLAYYWFSREMGREGLEWLTVAIAAVPERPSELLAMSYRAVSTMHTSLSEYESAYQALLKGLSLLPDDIEPTQRARFLNSMGNTLLRLGRFKEALDQFHKGIAFCEAAGDHNIKNTIRGNSGFVLYFAGELDEAERVINETISELEGGDNNDWLAHFVHNSGLVAKVRGDYALAEARFIRARKLIEENEVDPAARSWLNDAAQVAIRQGKREEALDFIRRSAAAVGKSKGHEQQAECIEVAAEYCEAVGNGEEAVALLAVVMRMAAPPQRSLADKSPTTKDSFERLQRTLSPDRFRKACARYKGMSARDVLEEVEDLDRPV